MIANEVKSKLAIALATKLDMVEEAVECFLRAANFSAEAWVCTVAYDAVEHVILDKISTAVSGKTICKQVDEYFKARKAAGSLGQRLLCKEEFFIPIA